MPARRLAGFPLAPVSREGMVIPRWYEQDRARHELGSNVEDGLLNTNPVHGIRTRKLGRGVSPAERQQRVRPMNYEQLDTFLKTAEAQCPPRDALYFLVMADTGLRPGEGAGLQWSDVDCATENSMFRGRSPETAR
jgi:integrase